MKYHELSVVRVGLLCCLLLALVACDVSSPAEQENVATVTVEQSTVTTAPLPTPTPRATAAPPATPTSRATIALATATSEPSPTADPAAVGLSCPATPPVKPDYARYVLSAEPWPTPDAGAPPPLALRDPLPGAERNTGYPYGSDGSGRYLLHNGLDMADEDAAPAAAAGDGTVQLARGDQEAVFGWRCDWYGQFVVIQLDEQWDGQPVYLLYGHVGDIQVSEGQRVAAGDAVARQSAAGAATVPHLHLEIRVGANTFGATRNPALWLRPPTGTGLLAGRLVDPDGRAWQGVTVTLIDPRGEADFLNSWTYLDDPDHLIQPEPYLGENFIFGPIPAGSYDVYTRIEDVEYRQTVEVVEGAISSVEIVTEAVDQ